MKEILAQIKQYKKDSILTPVFTALEVFMEMLLPFIMAKIIDDGIEKGNMTNVYIFGGVMVVAAMVSLLSGFLAGKYAASASSGFACNLREAIYRKVQTYSFSNIDKFSTAGLVTRMTTDVTNVQNAYQMIIPYCSESAADAHLLNGNVLCSKRLNEHYIPCSYRSSWHSSRDHR